MNDILATLYFFLPAFVANGAPMLAGRPRLFGLFNRPIDCGRSLFGNRIFGDHKTVRGILSAVLAALMVTSFQVFISSHLDISRYELMPYRAETIYTYGFLFGIGSVVGDLAGSFIKRRLGISPGTWFPVMDQTDYIVGVVGTLAVFLLLPPVENIAIGFLVLPPLTLFCSWVSVRIGLKSSI